MPGIIMGILGGKTPICGGCIKGCCPIYIGIGGLIGKPLGPASPGGAIPIGGTTYIALPIG